MFLVPISDLHIELNMKYFNREVMQEKFGFLRPLLDTDTTVLCACGDIGVGFSGLLWLQQLTEMFQGLQVVYVAGNHEFYGQKMSLLERMFLDVQEHLKNIHLLVGSTPYFIDGVAFIGATLWTDCKGQDNYIKTQVAKGLNDYTQILGETEPISINRTINQHFVDLKSILRGLGSVRGRDDVRKTVVLTHHSPLPPSNDLDPLSYAFHCTDVLDKLEQLPFTPDYWFYGHTHQSGERVRVFNGKECCFLSNQHGYFFENKTGYLNGLYLEV